MSDTHDQWEDLWVELGLEAPKTPPAPPKPVLPPPAPEVEEIAPPPVMVEEIAPPPAVVVEEVSPPPILEELLPEPVAEMPPLDIEIPPFAEDLVPSVEIIEEVAEEITDEADEPEEGAPDAELTEGEKTGRRRRRRRRRGGKKEKETATVEGTEPAEHAPRVAPVAVKKVLVPTTPVDAEGFGEDDEEPELLEAPGLVSAMDEELESDEAQPSAEEWSVVSWAELIGTLHRPER